MLLEAVGELSNAAEEAGEAPGTWNWACRAFSVLFVSSLYVNCLVLW